MFKVGNIVRVALPCSELTLGKVYEVVDASLHRETHGWPDNHDQKEFAENHAILVNDRGIVHAWTNGRFDLVKEKEIDYLAVTKETIFG